jgi:hypothetical protein
MTLVSLQKINHIKNIYLRYCFSQKENARRLKDVLSGNFKPLFGIQGALHIHGHKHIPMNLDMKMTGYFHDILHDEDVNAVIQALCQTIKTQDFQRTLTGYKKDKEEILHIIKTSHITKI